MAGSEFGVSIRRMTELNNQKNTFNPNLLPNAVANRGTMQAPSRTPHIWYSSNPFLAIIQGLIVALLENSVPILLIPIAALVFIIITSLIPMLVGSFVGGSLFMVIVGIWACLQIAISVLALNLHLQLMMASFHQERISISKAVERALSRPGSFLLLAIVCMLPILAPFYFIFLSTTQSSVIIGGFLLIPAYVIISRLWLSFFFFFENQYTFKMSLVDSWELTKGRGWEMLGVFSAQFPLGVLGALFPLISTSGFTTRYFQLRYIKSRKLESSVKIHWINYLLSVLLTIFSAYLVLWRYYQIVDNKREVCYSVNGINSGGYTNMNEFCVPKDQCDQISECSTQFTPIESGSTTETTFE